MDRHGGRGDFGCGHGDDERATLERGQFTVVQIVHQEGTVDGVEIQLPDNLKAVTVINIPSYSGGANLWGTAPTEEPFHKPQTDDGMLEVVGMCGPVHSLMTMTGAGRAYRLAQV